MDISSEYIRLEYSFASHAAAMLSSCTIILQGGVKDMSRREKDGKRVMGRTQVLTQKEELLLELFPRNADFPSHNCG